MPQTCFLGCSVQCLSGRISWFVHDVCTIHTTQGSFPLDIFSHFHHQQIGHSFPGWLTSSSDFPEHFLSPPKEPRESALGLEEWISGGEERVSVSMVVSKDFSRFLVCAQSLQLCLILAAPWAVAHQLLCPWDFPDKNTGVGCHIPSSRGSSWPRDQTCISCISYISGRFFTTEPPGKLISKYHCNWKPWKDLFFPFITDINLKIEELWQWSSGLWLRLCASTAGGTGSIPTRGTKIPHATAKKLNLKKF